MKYTDSESSSPQEATRSKSLTKPAEPKLSIGRKAAWATGSVSDNLLINGFNLLVMPIYNIALGVNPILLGYAIAIPRAIDVIIDPFVGNFSDNLRTRWGRRRPMIALGAILMGFFFSLIWLPPVFLGKTGLFIYFLATCMFFYVGYGLFAIPYQALGFELTTDYHERTRVQAWRMVVAYGSGLLMPWLYKLTLLPAFGGNEVVGVRVIGPIVGVIGLLCSLTPAIFCRENAAAQSQPHIGFFKACKCTFKNRPFLLLMGAVFTVLLAVSLSTPFMIYINIYYVYGGSKELASTLTGWSGTIQGLSGIVAAPLISILGTRFSKKSVILWGEVIALLGFLLCWPCISPKHPYLQLFPQILIFPGLACVWVLVGSMIADICDVDELENGTRREGMFGAVMMTVAKAGIALVTIVSGYMLVLSGYKDGPVQTTATLFNMRLFYVFIPIGFLFLSIIFMAFSPLTETRAREIRLRLEERKKSVLT
jgi:glycoside/pentoside/hexuronide:cation symporter, GPH family